MINSEALSESINGFARKVKIKDKKYKQLRERRNSIVDLIKKYSNESDLNIVDQFNVGSYKIKTGVERNGANGWAFDIDYVLAYDEEFEYDNFKNKLTNFLRAKVKDKYKRNVIIRNKKKVISIAFRDKNNESTMFYLDIALYLKDDEKLHHIQRDNNGNYFTTEGEPKETHERQRQALSENESKRNSILTLKYLQEKNRINGTSSIFITDYVIEQSDDLDTFSLIKKFVEENLGVTIFRLKELPNSNLIKDSDELNESLSKMNEKFFTSNETTVEVHKAMNSWLDYKLPDLNQEIMEEERNERYSGG